MIGFCELTKLDELVVVRQLAERIWPQTYEDILSPGQISYMMEMMYAPAVLERELLHERIRFFRFDVDETPVGFLSIGPTAEPGVAKLHKLYLISEYHGKGCGTMMLIFAMEIARKSGFGKLHLNVNKRNAKALRAYERNGFTTIRGEVNPISNGYAMDDFVMEKIL